MAVATTAVLSILIPILCPHLIPQIQMQFALIEFNFLPAEKRCERANTSLTTSVENSRLLSEVCEKVTAHVSVNKNKPEKISAQAEDLLKSEKEGRCLQQHIDISENKLAHNILYCIFKINLIQFLFYHQLIRITALPLRPL